MKKIFLTLLISFIITGCGSETNIYYDSDGCRKGFYIDVNGMCTKIETVSAIDVEPTCLAGDEFDGEMCQPNNYEGYACDSGYQLINYDTCALSGTYINFSKCRIDQTYSSVNDRCYDTKKTKYTLTRTAYLPLNIVTCPSDSEQVGESCVKVISEEPVK